MSDTRDIVLQCKATLEQTKDEVGNSIFSMVIILPCTKGSYLACFRLVHENYLKNLEQICSSNNRSQFIVILGVKNIEQFKTGLTFINLPYKLPIFSFFPHIVEQMIEC